MVVGAEKADEKNQKNMGNRAKGRLTGYVSVGLLNGPTVFATIGRWS
jgi:hypothetical protein